MSYLVRSGTRWNVMSEREVDLHSTLPVGNYIVQIDRNGAFFLEEVDKFELNHRLYGDVEVHTQRILNTYRNRGKSTGVLFSGEKGSGKSLTVKNISIEASKQGIPTIIINKPLVGDTFFRFIQNIQQECIIFFDEFEKIYKDDERSDTDHPNTQELLLTLLDGTFESKKLFLFTTNNSYKINDCLINRPGRIHYYLEFEGLCEKAIKDYSLDNLKKEYATEEYIANILQISSYFEYFTFDMLTSLISEVNMYGEKPEVAIKWLNLKPDRQNIINSFSVELKVLDENGNWVEPLVYDKISNENIFEERNAVDYRIDKSDSWNTVVFTIDNLKDFDRKSGTFVFKIDTAVVKYTRLTGPGKFKFLV